MRFSPEMLALLDNWIPTIIPAATGLVGVLVGAGLTSWFAARRERIQRRHAFIEKQLSEFYSPMLGLRAEVKALSDLRVKLQSEAGAAWGDLCAAIPEGAGKPEALQALTAQRYPPFSALIEHENKKLIDRLLPAYRKMVKLFRKELWLAEEGTRAYYPELIEFVDIWDRALEKSIPPEVITRIGHTENKLQPFYEHLQKQHDRLRSLIARGEA